MVSWFVTKKIGRSSKRGQWAFIPVFAHILIVLLLWCWILAGVAFPQSKNGGMTQEKALELAEEFGLDVGEVDEEIREILGLTRAEGVVVYAVIGATPADRAGIRVKAILTEVDGKEIRNLLDLGRALQAAMPTENFTVATFEPASPDDQGVGGGLNFHFVRIDKD